MSKVTITIEADNVTMRQISKLSKKDKKAVLKNASGTELVIEASSTGFVEGFKKGVEQ